MNYMKYYFENYPYVFFAMLGLVVSILFALFFMFSRYQVNKYFDVIILSLFGMILCARLFGILSRVLYFLIEYGEFKLIESIKQSGIVFFGGLIGYILCAKLLCKFKNRRFEEISDVIALIVPLFHFFGRLGCFYTGCCYGKASNLLFTMPCKVIGAETLEYRIPVQLYEAGFEMLLFIFLLVSYITKKYRQQELLYVYLLLYSIWRFIIEFFRDDTMRGVYFVLSFSQIISVLIFIYVAYKKEVIKK